MNLIRLLPLVWFHIVCNIGYQQSADTGTHCSLYCSQCIRVNQLPFIHELTALLHADLINFGYIMACAFIRS